VGYLIANRAVGLDILARVLNLTQREAADLVARLVSKGVLKGYTIDLQGQTIYREAPPAQASPPPSTPGGASPYVGVVKPDVSLDEPVKIKAQLWELEVLKQKGQISDQAYAKLKDELEKKLAAAETGTRVYA
jgi:DNA-binding Lrp family transcriptional regulator